MRGGNRIIIYEEVTVIRLLDGTVKEVNEKELHTYVDYEIVEKYFNAKII